MAWSVQTRKTLALSIGYFCIFVFFSLTTYIVYVFYTSIAPSVLDKKQYAKFVFHIIFGNWLAVNIYFNYLMAWLTSPGLAKEQQELAKQYPVCRKCSANKPPRTHHCSWCDLCILKFDHHCPWLNNCVGFYNHRYFFQFCCYMVVGCFYAAFFGFREYQIALLGKEQFSYSDALWHPFLILDTMEMVGFITYYIFIAVLTIAFLLLGLIFWHGRMIGNGVTSLERVLNQDYAQQCQEHGYLFVNPYDFGWWSNWKRFLGAQTIGQFVRGVLLPSTHTPIGDGITWEGYNVNRNLQADRPLSKYPARPIAFPPDSFLNPRGFHPNARQRPIVPPWEKPARPTHTSATYQPRTPAAQARKDQ